MHEKLLWIGKKWRGADSRDEFSCIMPPSELNSIELQRKLQSDSGGKFSDSIGHFETKNYRNMGHTAL